MMQKRIVCFGDSNTWGYDAENNSRFSEEIRWPSLVQQWMGNKYQVIEEGLMGRTSVCEDPLTEGLNAWSYIQPCLKSHSPLELVILMLGTNDTKERFNLTSYNIAQGIVRLATKAQHTNTGGRNRPPKIVVVAPPMIDSRYKTTNIVRSMGEKCDVKSKEFPMYLQELLADSSIDYLDASISVPMNEVDYMHLNKRGHHMLAKLIYEKIEEIM